MEKNLPALDLVQPCNATITPRENSPSSSLGTNFEAIDLIAINEVPLTISTRGAVMKKFNIYTSNSALQIESNNSFAFLSWVHSSTNLSKSSNRYSQMRRQNWRGFCSCSSSHRRERRRSSAGGWRLRSRPSFLCYYRKIDWLSLFFYY